jgi:hypothetical protein
MPRKRWPPSAVLITRQAAHHVGLAPGTLAKARLYGGGPPWVVLLKGAVRYRVSDLDAWIATRRRETSGELAPDRPQRPKRARARRRDGDACP